MINLRCPHCAIHLEVEDAFAGASGPCPACSGTITAPKNDGVDVTSFPKIVKKTTTEESKKEDIQETLIPIEKLPEKSPTEKKLPEEKEDLSLDNSKEDQIEKKLDQPEKRKKKGFAFIVCVLLMAAFATLLLVTLKHRSQNIQDDELESSTPIPEKLAPVIENTKTQEAKAPEAETVLNKERSMPVLITQSEETKPPLPQPAPVEENKPVLVKPKVKLTPELIIKHNIRKKGEAPELELPTIDAQ